MQQQQPNVTMSQRSNSSHHSSSSAKYPEQNSNQVNLHRYNFDYNQSQNLDEPRDFIPQQYAGPKSSDIPLIHNTNPQGVHSNNWQPNIYQSLQPDQRFIKPTSFNYNDQSRPQSSFQQHNQSFQGINQQNPNLHFLQLLSQNINSNQPNNPQFNEALNQLGNQYNSQSMQQSQIQLQLFQLLQQNNQNQLYPSHSPDPFQNKNKQQFTTPQSTLPFDRSFPNQPQPPQLQNLQNLQNNQAILQAILSQSGLLNQQNQPPTRQTPYSPPMYSNDNSHFTNTPLESSRSMAPDPQPSQTQFPQGVQQHNQYFVQNYASMQDNLSQYKRLISYLEQIDLQKKSSSSSTSSGNYLPSTSITIPPQVQRYENQLIDFNPNSDEFAHGTTSTKQSNTNIVNESKIPHGSVPWPSQISEIKSQQPLKPSQNYWTNTNQIQEKNENLSTQEFQSEGKVQKASDFLNDQQKEDEINNTSHFLNENNIKKLDEQVADQFRNQVPEISQAKQVYGSKSVKSVNHEESISNNPHSPISEHKSAKLQNKRSPNSNLIEEFNDNKSSAQKVQRSTEHTLLQEEVVNKVDEIPIANVQMTFEELLESKLQQERDQVFGSENGQKPKREFLRKGSNSAMATSTERTKSKTKYKYYADNFSNQNPSQMQPQPMEQQNLSQSRLGKTPAAPQITHHTNQSPQVIKKNQIDTSNKKYQTQQKPNSRQPTQQTQKAQQPRPASQTSQASQQPSSTKPSNYTQTRSNRHNIGQISSVTPNQLRVGIRDEEVMLTDRNSIAEFEMLERECIAKCTQDSPEEVFEKAKPEKEKKSARTVKKSPSSNNQVVEKEVLKQNQEQKRMMDQKIKELEKEIAKFRKENQKVVEMQAKVEKQLQRVNQEIIDFEEKKVQELKEIDQWRQEQEEEMKEQKEELEREKEEYRMLRELSAKKTETKKQAKDELARENETLLNLVDALQRENDELKDKIDDLTDKQYNCASTQTQQVLTFNVQCNTEPVSVQGSPEKNKSVMSPNVHQYKVDDVIEEEEAEEDGSKPGSSMNDEMEEDCEIPGEEDKVDQIESEEDEYDLKFPPEYHGKAAKSYKLSEEVIGHDGKIQRIYENGKKEVIFTNGVKREVWPDGYSIVYFNNNDIKQTFSDGKIVYFFSDAKTTQTTFPNGLQVFKFANSQVEKHFIDGTKEISFPDGTIKCLFPDGEEESIFPDGTIQKIEKSGIKIIEFPSGQRDVIYPDGVKIREFEDGNVKKIYPDGRTEILPSKAKKLRQSSKTVNANNQKNKR